MRIPNDIEEPFRYSWGLVKILVIIIVILVLAYIFYIYVLPKLRKSITKVQVPNLKAKYLKKLQKLLHDVENNRISMRDAYMELSNIIRTFIEKATGINVLSITKEEARRMNNPELSMLMEEYYPPEFAKEANGDIIGSIHRTIDVMQKWN